MTPVSTSAPGTYADVIVVGGTPGGITSAIAAARMGCSVILLERTSHIGGLVSNGLGATDISTRGLAAGLFKEFTRRNRAYYAKTCGEDSPQVAACSEGFFFEPSVAERTLQGMLDDHPNVKTLKGRQFDAQRERVERENGQLRSIRVRDLSTGNDEIYTGKAFIDATYEGDLAAAAGVPFSTRREGTADYGEPMAGRQYQEWYHPEIGEGSTGEGDDTIQAYNFRLCLTDRPENRVPFPKPDNYNREEYASLADDLKLDRMPGKHVREREWDGIGRVTNIVWLPNGKTDANNQHLAFISTDLPEENYPWPTSDWAWRDNFQKRLRDYTLGLFWFIQNDPEVPESFRTNAQRFGLAADEYTDNGNFPRQVYVREGRRVLGEHSFLAHDALPLEHGGRPPIHQSSITASHYPVDSHAVRKREPNRLHLDGFISVSTAPYTVPYGVIVPRTVDNLWTPVPVSASHLGFGTLRMEPCWMAMGEAAGTAAALAIRLQVPARSVPIARMQREMVAAGAMLIFYRDVQPQELAYAAVQYFGLLGAVPGWEAKLDEKCSDEDASRWAELCGSSAVDILAGATRRDVLVNLWEQINPSAK